MCARGAVTGCLALVCLAALLAERTEGHITFFSPKEMMVLKVSSSKVQIFFLSHPHRAETYDLFWGVVIQNPVGGSSSRSVFQTWLPFVFVFFSHQQEQEGRKFMEPRSEDDQFEEVTVQQLPEVKHTRAHTHQHVCRETENDAWID